jgi:hypothetical protein
MVTVGALEVTFCAATKVVGRSKNRHEAIQAMVFGTMSRIECSALMCFYIQDLSNGLWFIATYM